MLVDTGDSSWHRPHAHLWLNKSCCFIHFVRAVGNKSCCAIHIGEVTPGFGWPGFILGMCGWGSILCENFAGESSKASGNCSSYAKKEGDLKNAEKNGLLA